MASVNQPQIEFWNGPAAARWVKEQERLDRAFAPLEELATLRAMAAPGEHVVDIGCGCGASALRLGGAVGPKGHVLGIDVSAPMLARAAKRAESSPWIEFLQADAAEHAFVADAHLLYSRFGFMFFADPRAAFTNLRRALRPGGRLLFVCWRSPEENPWFSLPLRAAATVLSPLPPTEPDAPGPFAFASADRLREILAHAGFAAVTIERHDAPLVVSDGGSPPSLEAAVDFAVETGRVSSMLLDAGPDAPRRVRAAIGGAFASDPRGLLGVLTASVWLATARV